MANYFTDNTDLLFHFDRLKLEEVVDIAELGGFRAYQAFLAANSRLGQVLGLPGR